MSENLSKNRDTDADIDLEELFAKIWAQKFSVLMMSSIAMLIAIVYLNFFSTPTYEARAKFELLGDQSAQSFGDLGGLAILTGLPGGSGEAETLEDRIFSRSFIAGIYDIAEFELDPLYNRKLSEQRDIEESNKPSVVSAELALQTKHEVIGGVLRAFSKDLKLEVLPNGLVEVSLRHLNGERAATLVNIIVAAAIDDIHRRARDLGRKKLDYFSDQLGEVQSDLDEANLKLSEFALSGNLRSNENLARASTQLTVLRKNAVVLKRNRRALEKLLQLKNAEFQPKEFLDEFPFAEQISFRRILNWGGDSDAWTNPSPDFLLTTLTEIEAELAANDRNIFILQEQATEHGKASLHLSELKRNVGVQESIFAAMIQQFEAQSLSTGFETASGDIIDAAIIPGAPTSPNKVLIVGISMILGAVIGVVSSLLKATRVGRLYTRSAISNSLNLNKVEWVREGLNNSVSRVRFFNSDKPNPVSLCVEKLVVSLGNEASEIFLLPAGTGRLSAKVSLELAGRLSLMEQSVCIFNVDSGDTHIPQNISSNIEWVDRDVEIELSQRSEMLLQFEKLRKSYDIVIVLGARADREILSSYALSSVCGAILVVAEVGRVTKSGIKTAGAVAAAAQPTNAVMVIA